MRVLILLLLISLTGCTKIAREPLFAGGEDAKYINVHCGDGAANIQGNAPAVTGAIGGRLNSFTLVIKGEFSEDVILATLSRPCGLEETLRGIMNAEDEE